MRIIAGAWRGRRLKTLKGRNVRPTTDRVREAWMSALGSDVVDAVVLDLFAGSGALGLEALSRGARSVTLVEKAGSAARVIRENVALVGAEERAAVVQDDVFRFLDRSGEAADVAFADPPYDSGDAQRLVDLWLDEPFAKQLWLEHRSRDVLDVPDGARTRRYGDTALTTLTAEPTP